MVYTIDLTQPRKVLGIRFITPDTFVLRFDRRGFNFAAGKHISVGLPGDETREYSIFSGETDDFLEILIRRVEGGNVSRRLSLLQPGDKVHVKGPKGRFLLSKAPIDAPLVLIASGTGIAPMRSFIRSEPGLSYTLVHGIRHLGENFGSEFAEPSRHILCVSREGILPEQTETGVKILSGRVTDWLQSATLTEETHFYLCGNQGMLESSGNILTQRGFPLDHIHSEKYF